MIKLYENDGHLILMGYTKDKVFIDVEELKKKVTIIINNNN